MSKSAYDVLIECCPILVQGIEEKVNTEVASRDKKIASLEKTIDDLTTTILSVGGVI